MFILLVIDDKDTPEMIIKSVSSLKGVGIGGVAVHYNPEIFKRLKKMDREKLLELIKTLNSKN